MLAMQNMQIEAVFDHFSVSPTGYSVGIPLPYVRCAVTFRFVCNRSLFSRSKLPKTGRGIRVQMVYW